MSIKNTNCKSSIKRTNAFREVSVMDLHSTMMNQPVTRSREMGGEGNFH